jgi:hypothetical protein
MLAGGLVLLIIAMMTWPTSATAVSTPNITLASTAATPTPAPMETTEPLHDPFFDSYAEFADAGSLRVGGAAGSVPGLDPNAKETKREPVVSVCLTVGSVDKSTVPYAIVEIDGRREYVTLGDAVGTAHVEDIDFDKVTLDNRKTLQRATSRCAPGSSAGASGSGSFAPALPAIPTPAPPPQERGQSRHAAPSPSPAPTSSAELESFDFTRGTAGAAPYARPSTAPSPEVLTPL